MPSISNRFETYKPRLGKATAHSITVSVVVQAELAEWLAKQTVLEQKSVSQIVRRALMFERDRVKGEARFHPVTQELEYMTPEGPV